MMDLLKNKNQTRRIGTTGIERVNEDSEELSDASGIQSFGRPKHGYSLERDTSAIKETLKEKERAREEAEAEEGTVNARPKKVDIRQYRDPEGLTLEKMEIGLWLVKHRQHMINILRGFLILVCVVAWGRFLYVFGYYTVAGMRSDQKNIAAIVNTDIVGHDYFIARSPREIVSGPVELIGSADDKYDLAVEISNENKEYWADFDYYFKVGDREFGHKRDFVLPGEKKYILDLNEDSAGIKGNITMNISRIDWTRVDPHKYHDWENYRNDHLNISVSGVKFTPAQSTVLTEKLHLNDLSFTVTNKTPFNYWQANFNILLLGSNRILGVNSHVLNNFMSGETREVSATWPGMLGNINNIVITPDINITRDDIYIKF